MNLPFKLCIWAALYAMFKIPEVSRELVKSFPHACLKTFSITGRQHCGPALTKNYLSWSHLRFFLSQLVFPTSLASFLSGKLIKSPESRALIKYSSSSIAASTLVFFFVLFTISGRLTDKGRDETKETKEKGKEKVGGMENYRSAESFKNVWHHSVVGRV